MCSVVNDVNFLIYRVGTRHIELVTIGRLLLLVDDVLTGWRFGKDKHLQVILSRHFHRQNHVPHEVDQPRWDFILHAACQEFLIFEHVSSPFQTKIAPRIFPGAAITIIYIQF